MRVHVNGMLPLIKTSIIEYPNGDEVTATLVYENLEKHCLHCGRLDHEIRDCLEAKHQNKERLPAQKDSQKVLLQLPTRKELNMRNTTTLEAQIDTPLEGITDTDHTP
ncbi:hypothetical protein HID58_092551 [Brassica napus]|uniref:CCHC-type domain-containing protein n=2 Tax=Brassica napus TaxID=3708 RepID=A0ABQ7WYF2_BRANA|nr:hypothetical protein HID58_092551 [Brassica napus]